jgi:hypothetical protein
MKVICVKKIDINKDTLTIGKIYDIFSHTASFTLGGTGEAFVDTVNWFIADDGSELLYFDNDKDFITLEKCRDNQLNKVGI